MSKINIQIEEGWLDVPEDLRLKMTFYSQVFPDNWNRRDHSFPGEFAKTPNNNKLLAHKGEIGITVTNFDVDCKVYQDKTFLFNGVLRISDIGKTYSFHLLTTFGSWDHRTLGKTLQDFQYDSDQIFTLTDQEVVDGQYPDVPFAFPAFYAFKFFADQRGTMPLQTYDWHAYYGVPTTGGATPPYPSPYIMYVLDSIFQESGFNPPTGTFKQNDELKKLLMISNRHRPEDNTDWIFDAGKHLPEMKVSDFLTSLRAMFNIGVFFEKQNNDVRLMLNEAILQNPDYIDWTEKTPLQFIKSADKAFGEVRIQQSQELQELYPEIGIKGNFTGPLNEESDAFNSVQQLGRHILTLASNTYWTPNAEYGDWSPLDYNAIIADPTNFPQLTDVADFADLQTPAADILNSICLVQNEHWYYRCIYDQFNDLYTWIKFLYDNYGHNINVENPAIDLECKIAVPVMDRTGVSLAFNQLLYVPSIKNVLAISDLFNMDNTKHMSMMVFNRGVQPQGSGYPDSVQFSSDEYNYNKDVIGNFSLLWNGERGLINTHWKTTLGYLRNAQVYKFRPMLTLTDFMNFTMDQKVYLHGMKGMVKQMDVEFPLTKPATITFVA